MNLPSEFVCKTKELIGDNWEQFASSLESVPPVCIRLNRLKPFEFIQKKFESVEWCENGYYLPEKPQFTFDPLFHAGCYYVQEASSMFVAQAMKQYAGSGGVKVLDLCAAPGGKSTLIADNLDADSLLVSNEVIRTRANILAENITKWGRANEIVTNNDPKDIGQLTNFFDVILVDAPCSGEGMFRKDQKAIEEWSWGNVNLCKDRQRRILADIWSALKPGGILIYSTCTYNMEENEYNVQWMQEEFGAKSSPVNIDMKWGITPSFVDGVVGYHFLPHKTKGEGFFLSVLQKNENTDFSSKKKFVKIKAGNSRQSLAEKYQNYILKKELFTFFQRKDKWYAFPSNLLDELLYVDSKINIISSGICLGMEKGNGFIPDHSLAMSPAINKDSFTILDIDWQTAISFLRSEAIVLHDQPKGYILLTYKNVPIGFVKNIGNRANNLYPHEWRIRSSNIPQEKVQL